MRAPTNALQYGQMHIMAAPVMQKLCLLSHLPYYPQVNMISSEIVIPSEREEHKYSERNDSMRQNTNFMF